MGVFGLDGGLGCAASSVQNAQLCVLGACPIAD